MELDARTAPDGVTLAAEICIVGAGPAGLALARQLERAGRTVLLLESGGYQRDEKIDELNDGEVLGDPYQQLRLTRARHLGGTAAIWNTWLSGHLYAKYVPLDEVDFQPRDELSRAGWPFGKAILDPYYVRAQEVCGLGPFEYGAPAWNGEEQTLRFRAGGLVNGVYQYGPADRFLVELPRLLVASSSATLVTGATVTGLTVARTGERVTEARWAAPSGNRGVAWAETFVLAAGAIENARLLLLAGRDSAWLGCGFMEHPIDATLRLATRHPALWPTPGFYAPHNSGADLPPILGRIGFSAELLRGESLPNASLRLVLEDEPRLLQSVTRWSAARRLVPDTRIRRWIGNRIRDLARLTARTRSTSYQILVDLEQVPHPENRLTLSGSLDQFGQPRIALWWQWRPEDEAQRARLLSIAAHELERARAGQIETRGERALDPNAHHHTGTTRMHPDPRAGVVDSELRVHGIENLYVTGASVFPTAGFANPTLTAIALTLRLADHLTPR